MADLPPQLQMFMRGCPPELDAKRDPPRDRHAQPAGPVGGSSPPNLLESRANGGVAAA
jgi:hypothetical protein